MSLTLQSRLGVPVEVMGTFILDLVEASDKGDSLHTLCVANAARFSPDSLEYEFFMSLRFMGIDDSPDWREIFLPEPQA